MAWGHFPEVGGTLADALVLLMRDGSPLPFQLRRVKSSAVDVVLIETFSRVDGAATLLGASFTSPWPAAAPPQSALSRLVEMTLTWALIDELARELDGEAALVCRDHGRRSGFDGRAGIALSMGLSMGRDAGRMEKSSVSAAFLMELGGYQLRLSD